MRGSARTANVAALLALVAWPTSAVASSHVANWNAPNNEVGCGITEVFGTQIDAGTQAPLNGLWPGLQCSAPGIPRAPSKIGDPVVQLGQGRAGRARLVNESQDDLIVNTPAVKLPAGSTWRRYGITCAVHPASIRCTNSVGHGFTMSVGHIHLF